MQEEAILDSAETLDEATPRPVAYPELMDRARGMIADYVVIFCCLYGVTVLFEKVGPVPDPVKIVTWALILLYDPIMVSLFGGTIGHFIARIRVKQMNDATRNIPFHLAVVRFVVKVALGWISFLTVSGHQKKMALHDLLVGSTVICK